LDFTGIQFNAEQIRNLAQSFVQGASEDRRALINAARAFTSKTVRENPNYGHFQKELESDQIYFKLRPHLSDHFKQALTGGRILVGPGREESQMPGIASLFIREIERLEKEWGLQI
jgi:hypothetical protein